MKCSAKFEIHLHGSHMVGLPRRDIEFFLKTGQRRVEVRAFFEGREIKFHAALQKRKGGYFIMFSKAKQKALHLFPGNYFHLQLCEDQTAFGVEIPPELQETFSQWPEAHAAFLELSDGSKRSLIYGIARYKTPQKRVDKSLQICERLSQGIRKTRNLLN